MKLIQSYNPIQAGAGFATVDGLRQYLAESYAVHKALVRDGAASGYKMYTSVRGAEVIGDIFEPGDIEIITFPVIRYDQIPFIGKFVAQQMQTGEYLHIDLDATLFAMPAPADMYCEKYRAAPLGTEASVLGINIRHIRQVPCSSIIGFSDMAFRDAYLSRVMDKIASFPRNFRVTYELCWNLEETMLEEMRIAQNKSVSICPESEHLYFKVMR
jgi:hypothetical protein